MKNNLITVNGNCHNISGHAAVITDSSAIYVIEGKSEWEREWVNRGIRIMGDLVTQKTGTEDSEAKIKVVRSAVIMLLTEEKATADR